MPQRIRAALSLAQMKLFSKSVHPRPDLTIVSEEKGLPLWTVKYVPSLPSLIMYSEI